MNWTQEELAARNREVFGIPCGHPPTPNEGVCGIPWCETPVATLPRPEPRRGTMNKLEARFRDEVLAGKVRWYDFEAVKFRLADGAWYTPDFVVQDAHGLYCFYEVKGFWREAARVRIKVAADKYPFPFIAVTRNRKTGEWEYERFSGRAS